MGRILLIIERVTPYLRSYLRVRCFGFSGLVACSHAGFAGTDLSVERVSNKAFRNLFRETRAIHRIMVTSGVGRGGKGAWMRVQVRGFKIAGSRTLSALKPIG